MEWIAAAGAVAAIFLLRWGYAAWAKRRPVRFWGPGEESFGRHEDGRFVGPDGAAVEDPATLDALQEEWVRIKAGKPSRFAPEGQRRARGAGWNPLDLLDMFR